MSEFKPISFKKDDNLQSGELRTLFSDWAIRYNNYKPIKPVEIKDTVNNHAGDFGLKIPMLDNNIKNLKVRDFIKDENGTYKNEFLNEYQKRHITIASEIASSRIPADKERLIYSLAIEKTGIDFIKHKACGDKEKVEYSSSQFKHTFSQLINFDREHEHPIANPERDIKKDSYTGEEIYAWLNRDKRDISTEKHAMTKDELSYCQKMGYDQDYSFNGKPEFNTSKQNQGKQNQEWYVSNKLQTRFNQEREVKQFENNPELKNISRREFANSFNERYNNYLKINGYVNSTDLRENISTQELKTNLNLNSKNIIDKLNIKRNETTQEGHSGGQEGQSNSSLDRPSKPELAQTSPRLPESREVEIKPQTATATVLDVKQEINKQEPSKINFNLNSDDIKTRLQEQRNQEIQNQEVEPMNQEIIKPLQKPFCAMTKDEIQTMTQNDIKIMKNNFSYLKGQGEKPQHTITQNQPQQERKRKEQNY